MAGAGSAAGVETAVAGETAVAVAEDLAAATAVGVEAGTSATPPSAAGPRGVPLVRPDRDHDDPSASHGCLDAFLVRQTAGV